MKKSVIFASVAGNALEYYDFTIFAVFSSQIGKIFFPVLDEFLEIILSLAVFAVGFLMRPLGAIIFGHIGDKVGRKKALTFSIACMAIPTFIIGILPGYEYLGILAPILLILLRLIQGVSIGGEGAGSAIFMLEHNNRLKIGYLGGIITSSNFIGAFFATLVGLFISQFTSNIISWRYAFILGGILGVVGFYLRLKTFETPVFESLLKENKIANLPLLRALKYNKKQIYLAVCLGGIVGAFAYLILVYINVFFNKIVGLNSSLSLIYAALGIGSFILFLPLLGLWSDKVKYDYSIIQGCYMAIILIIPIFMMMTINNQILNIISVIIFSILGAWICAPAYPVMLSLFPAELRYSGIAFSFNVGLALFGGTAPIISTFLVKITKLNYAPSFYIIALSSLYIGVNYWVNHPKKLKSLL